MRKINLLAMMLMAAMSICFTNCSSDDDDNNGGGSSSSAMVGKWVPTHVKCVWYNQGVEKSVRECDVVDGKPADKSMANDIDVYGFEFTSANVSFIFFEDGEWVKGENKDMPYTVKDNVLTIHKRATSVLTFEIVKLDKNEMIMKGGDALTDGTVYEEVWTYKKIK